MNVSAVTASAVYLPMQALAPSVPSPTPVALSIEKVPQPSTTPRVSPVAEASKESSISRESRGRRGVDVYA
ncbi:MAG: hypothetical protein U0Q15_00965 [Kineosporiaceae bacterium]